jgi:trehalose 6-phosphate synthase/phosphatase
MLGADLIGFHTSNYTDNFLDCCQQLNVGKLKDNQIKLDNRLISISEFPMGIDYDKFISASQKRSVRKHLKKYKRATRGRKVILTVDRLDPTKGFIERLKAYQGFLRANPASYGKVVMVMVAVPSRGDIKAYQNLRLRVELLVKQINDEFGSSNWQPINYMATSLPFEELTALYQLADVAFVVPLRDGMNLVAKEYIASKPKQTGVLILSQTAGAAEELQNAITVDPLDNKSLVAALEKALRMPRRELRRRIGEMQGTIADFPVQDWAGTFMKTLKKTANTPVKAPQVTKSLTGNPSKRLVQNYRNSSNRLLLLDYDGVLAPFTNNPSEAKPSLAITNRLEKLASDEANQVVIVSGRSTVDLDNWLGQLNVNLAAEHGALIKPKGHKNWTKTHKLPRDWKKTILPAMEKYTAKVPESFIEQKTCSLVWHYRKASPYYSQKYAVVLKKELAPLVKPLGLKVYSGNKILEVKAPEANKGVVAKSWLAAKPDFILALGDDYTDEDTFAALPKRSWSIKIGRGRTKANYRLPKQSEVEKLLAKLVK